MSGRLVDAERLPELLDCKALRDELGVSRAAAEAIMRKLPTVQFEDLRKVFVRREDVRRYVQECTSEGEWRFAKSSVPV